jgi:hypothetical protein
MVRDRLSNGAHRPLTILLRMLLGMVAALLLCSGAAAQNMLSGAMMDCVRQGRPFTLVPDYRPGDMRGISSRSPVLRDGWADLREQTADGWVIRSPSSGLECQRGPTNSTHCRFSVDVGTELLRLMQ